MVLNEDIRFDFKAKQRDVLNKIKLFGLTQTVHARACVCPTCKREYKPKTRMMDQMLKRGTVFHNNAIMVQP